MNLNQSFTLTAFSSNVVKDFVHNDPSFPSGLVEGVEGDTLFMESGMQVRIPSLCQFVLREKSVPIKI